MKKYLTITGPIAVAMYLFLYLPLLTILFYSFIGTNRAGVSAITLEWYSRMFTNASLMLALQNTFILAVSSASISTVIGTMLGYGLDRYRFPGKRIFNGFLHVPIFLPDIVTAVSMLVFYAVLKVRFGILDKGILTMIIAHVTVQVPIVAIMMRARLEAWASTFEEAAADLGASPARRFRQITIPLVRPGVVAGGLLAFTLSLGDFVISYFTASQTSQTIPLVIFSRLKEGADGEIHALASIILITGLVCAVAATAVHRSKQYETA